jgi:hypothetical protein
MATDHLHLPFEPISRSLYCPTEAGRQKRQVHYKTHGPSNTTGTPQDTTLCTKLGVSLHRWQETVTTMLEKDHGRPKLHRLRVIHLLEADLNLLIKIILARRFVWHGEQHGAFGEAQFESRPGQSAIDVVLQKELMYDLATRTLNNLAIMENVATACFDRMIPSMVMIAMRAYGVPANITPLLGKMLAHTRYRIKTKLDICSEPKHMDSWPGRAY